MQRLQFDEPGASCRPDCTPARCGDGIVDPNELCDDGNTIPFDGCRADRQGQFTRMVTPIAWALTAVASTGPNDAYAVGTGIVLHYDGSSWTLVDLPTPTTVIYDVWEIAADDVYFVGSDGLEPLLLHFDGMTWTSIPPPMGVYALYGVWASSSTNVWVLGDVSGESGVDHYDGSHWMAPTPLITPCTNGGEPNSVFGTGPTDVYIGTYNGLCHYDGAALTLIDPTSVQVLRLNDPSPTSIITVTTIGTTETFWRWTSATSSMSVTTVPGNGTAMGAAGDYFYVAGVDGLVLEYDGTQWSNLVTPTSQSLYGVAASSPTNVFIVGYQGTVLH